MLSPYNSMVCAVWMIRSRMASAIVGSPTMSYRLGDGYCEVMIMDFLSCLSSIISSRMGRSLAGAGKRMCQNEPNPESQIKDFRGFSSFRELGNAANGIFYSSQCWESQFLLIFCFPNVGKANFRWFLIFSRGGKSIFADFWFSPARESWFSLIFDFPPWRKADFRRFLIFPREGKLIFVNFWFSPVAESRFSPIFDFPPWGKADFRRFLPVVPLRKPLFPDFRSSYPYESFFLPIFVRRTPTKASFCQFSFIVPLRKLLFPDFHSSYPYESLLFPFFINCTPYLSDFSRKSMIYARIWVVFLIEQFRIVDFQKGICALTRPLLLSVLPASAFFFIIPLNWFPRVKLGWECVTSKHSEPSCIMLRSSAAKFLGE